MAKTHNARSPQETAQAGLRLLARIIAREAVKDRRAKMEAVKPDPRLLDVCRSAKNPAGRPGGKGADLFG